MPPTTRLLLPFTGSLAAPALDCALQLATQQQLTLVPLALIPVQAGRGPRLELIQQAQDFLALTRRKASRQGVAVECSQIYTQDVARSIEAFASEMNCEAVLLFLSNRSEVLLNYTEVRALLEHTSCNLHMVLLPERRGIRSLPLHISMHRQSGELTPGNPCEDLPDENAESTLLLRRLMQADTR